MHAPAVGPAAQSDSFRSDDPIRHHVAVDFGLGGGRDHGANADADAHFLRVDRHNTCVDETNANSHSSQFFRGPGLSIRHKIFLHPLFSAATRVKQPWEKVDRK